VHPVRLWQRIRGPVNAGEACDTPGAGGHRLCKAYLDLQNRARAEGRATQELLTLYVVERWLTRLSVSPHADQFVLKGGM